VAASSFSVTICFIAAASGSERGSVTPERIFAAARENTGKNPFGAQNRRNSSQIDPYNQVLTSSFPVRVAGKKFSLPESQQGNSREGKKRDDRALLPILLHSIRFDRDRKMARFGAAPSQPPDRLSLDK
jgi:hypothetical protein